MAQFSGMGVSPAGSGVPPVRGFSRGKRPRSKMRGSAGEPPPCPDRLATDNSERARPGLLQSVDFH